MLDRLKSRDIGDEVINEYAFKQDWYLEDAFLKFCDYIQNKHVEVYKIYGLEECISDLSTFHSPVWSYSSVLKFLSETGKIDCYKMMWIEASGTYKGKPVSLKVLFRLRRISLMYGTSAPVDLDEVAELFESL